MLHAPATHSPPASPAQEAKILSRVRHQNIVRFYGGNIRPPSVFIVEELMEHDLSSLIHNSDDPLPLDQVRWGAGSSLACRAACLC